jgi:hypothetical protein
LPGITENRKISTVIFTVFRNFLNDLLAKTLRINQTILPILMHKWLSFFALKKMAVAPNFSKRMILPTEKYSYG